MKIQVIKKDVSNHFSNVVYNKLFHERIDLNEKLNDPNIETVQVIITRRCDQLDQKDTRLIKALGGYTSNMRLVRYFLLFYVLSLIIQSVFYFTHSIFPSHFWQEGNGIKALLFVLLSSIFIGMFGMFVDSIITIIRLAIFYKAENKREKE